MANVIQIKRSSVTSIPVSLAEGELAYSELGAARKLYIGTNGGASIQTIGGLHYTEQFDSVAQNTIKGRISSGTGELEDLTAANVRTIINVEDGATADQTDAEIETAYNNQVAQVSSGEISLGTSTDIRRFSPDDIRQMVLAHETGSPGDNTITNAKLADMDQNTIKGRVSVGTGDPEDLTATQVRTIINVEDGADVTDTANVDAAGATMNTDTDVSGNSWVLDEDNMSSDDATKVPTQQSVKAYVDAAVTSSLTYKGAYNASTNTPDLDTSPSGVLVGDTYTVTVAGTFFTEAVEVGDFLIAEVDDASTLSDWTIVQRNIDYATTTTPGFIQLATQVEVNAGTDATKAVTPDTLDGWTGSTSITTLGTIATGTWQGSVISTTYLENTSGTNTGDEVQATESVAGILEIATSGEVNTGTDNTRAVTPAGLAAWTGSTNITTVGTITTGTWQGDAIDSTYLPTASTTVQGIIEIATQTEVNTGTDNTRTVTPLTLANATLDGGTF
jgi:hypothetical protein